VGIEVPNSKREVISLRQILESDEFNASPSPLTIALGKDINGRIKVTALDTMPHLLIAGSTGSGKSVMLNSLIMSILYKATPRQVRMIMVDPKRLEFGLYEGIPHLLTPVITDAKKATNALRNAVLEMERRLKLLAGQGVRNIDQYNKKVKARFGGKPKMLGVDEVADITGHEVGGVCPFGLKAPLPIYCDVSLKAFDEVVPAAGSIHSAVRIAPSRMAELVAAEWVDVCEDR